MRAANATELSELLSALPVAVYTTDTEGYLTFYNPAAAQLWGREPELGASAYCGSWKLYWPDGRPMPHDECPMAVALITGEPVRGVEAILERPDGTRVPFIPYPTPLRDAAGGLVGAVNMLIDISERQNFERAVRAQTQRFQTLNTVARVIGGNLDLDRIAQTVTDSAVEISGATCGVLFYFSTDQPAQTKLVHVTAPRGGQELAIERNRALLDATLHDGVLVRSDDIGADPRCRGSGLTCRSDGRDAAVASYLAVPVRRLGKVFGALFLGHTERGIFPPEMEDVVAGIAAHAAVALDNAHLYAVESRLASIVATSNDAIVTKDLEGTVTSWNQAAEALFGYTAAEMIGRPIMTLIPADRQHEEEEILARVRRGEEVEHYETKRVRKDGAQLDVSLTISPLKNADGRIVGASKIARDITERKQAEARQELLAHELQHRTKNLFAVVHAVVSRSFAAKTSLEEAESAVLHRLHSLAHTHVMLLDKAWQGAELGDMVRAEMDPYTGRVEIGGPPIMFNVQAVQNFALALHELATNAAKYGALSNCTGQVRIAWSVSEDDGRRWLRFRWEETGGPPVSVPQRKGFGSAVLEQVMAEYFDSPPQVQFEPSGLVYELAGPLEPLTAKA